MSSEVPTTVLISRNRESLLNDYSLIKANAYLRIFGVPALIFIYVVMRNYYAEVNAMYIFITFIFVEIFLYVIRVEKKINILYEIEKCRDVDRKGIANEK